MMWYHCIAQYLTTIEKFCWNLNSEVKILLPYLSQSSKIYIYMDVNETGTLDWCICAEFFQSDSYGCFLNLIYLTT